MAGVVGNGRATDGRREVVGRSGKATGEEWTQVRRQRKEQCRCWES